VSLGARPGPSDHPSPKTVSRADLAERLRRHGFSHRQSAAYVRSIFDLMAEALVDEEAVKLPGFGKFEVVSRAPRAGRAFSTGEEVAVAAHRTVAFRPSRKLRDEMTLALRPPRR